MLRNVVLGIANRPAIRRAVTGGAGRRVALRFVAGEDLAHEIEVVRSLNAADADVSIDYLGEHVSDRDQAAAARAVYLAALDRIHGESLRANISVKLTQLGLDVDEAQAAQHLDAIAARAAGTGTTVTLDMEDHRYTERTIASAIRLGRARPGTMGVAVQTYLKRTPEDLERLIDARVGVRLCKGAYREPRRIAFRKRSEVDGAYAHLLTRLIDSESYAMIATHDERLVDHAIRRINKTSRAPGTYEFQMLYGIRKELQQKLLRQGFRLRVYVPFGTHWYPYLMRRVAERPANVRFLLEALARG